MNIEQKLAELKATVDRLVQIVERDGLKSNPEGHNQYTGRGSSLAPDAGGSFGHEADSGSESVSITDENIENIVAQGLKKTEYGTPAFKAYDQSRHAVYNSAQANRIQKEEEAKERPDLRRLKIVHDDAEMSNRTAASLHRKVKTAELDALAKYHKAKADEHKGKLAKVGGKPSYANRSDIGQTTRIR